MNHNIALMQAKYFSNKRKEKIRIAKANNKEDYYLLFAGEEPSKNYKVIETVNVEVE